MRRINPIGVLVIVLLIAFAGILAGCEGGSPPEEGQKSAIKEATDKAKGREFYKPTRDADFNNYNDRMRLADNPATILWCTFFPPGVQGVSEGSTPGQAITVPIAGKLTDAGVTPFPPAAAAQPYDTNGNTWYPFPAPDGMYGSAGDFRFGFDPTRAIYYEFTDLPAFCTSEPTVWQADATSIVVDTDTTLSSASRSAEAALEAGDADRALQILQSAGDR